MYKDPSSTSSLLGWLFPLYLPWFPEETLPIGTALMLSGRIRGWEALWKFQMLLINIWVAITLKHTARTSTSGMSLKITQHLPPGCWFLPFIWLHQKQYASSAYMNWTNCRYKKFKNSRKLQKAKIKSSTYWELFT